MRNIFSWEEADYIAAANPAAVLELIAEIDRLQAAKATLDRLGYTDNGGQLWKPPIGKKPDFDLIDQLKAENESLRKDAERYRWLRRGENYAHQYLIDLGMENLEGFDRSIDAAMSKESTNE